MDVKSLTGGFAQFNDLDIVCVLPSKLTGCFSLKARAVSTGRCVTTESHCSSPSQRSHAASQDSASLQMTDSSIFTEAIHEQKKKKRTRNTGAIPAHPAKRENAGDKEKETKQLSTTSDLLFISACLTFQLTNTPLQGLYGNERLAIIKSCIWRSCSIGRHKLSLSFGRQIWLE